MQVILGTFYKYLYLSLNRSRMIEVLEYRLETREETGRRDGPRVGSNVCPTPTSTIVNHTCNYIPALYLYRVTRRQIVYLSTSCQLVISSGTTPALRNRIQLVIRGISMRGVRYAGRD